MEWRFFYSVKLSIATQHIIVCIILFFRFLFLLHTKCSACVLIFQLSDILLLYICNSKSFFPLSLSLFYISTVDPIILCSHSISIYGDFVIYLLNSFKSFFLNTFHSVSMFHAMLFINNSIIFIYLFLFMAFLFEIELNVLY